MFEFTYGGAWFRWGALDAPSKRLMIYSLATAMLAGGMSGGLLGYNLGLKAGHSTRHIPDIWFHWVSGISIILCIISAIFWWRLSLRQDEMFNRIQNWALGMASSWSLVIILIWSYLANMKLAMPLHPLGMWGIPTVLLTAFWFRAVKKWA